MLDPKRLLVPSLLALMLAADSALALKVDIGGGVSLPFRDTTRDLFNANLSLSGGMAMQFPNNRGEVFVETGFARGSGSDLSDPTFEFPDSEFSLVPITFGFRPNLTPDSEQLQLMLEVGFQTVLTHFEDLGERDEDAATPGFLFGLRAEFPIDDGWYVWARQRFSLQSDIRYFDSIEHNFGGSEMHVGVAYLWPAQ